MERRTDRQAIRTRIKARTRRKVQGSSGRPRLAVFKSDRHIYVQAIDDGARRTLAAASTRDAEVKAKQSNGGNIAAAKAVGSAIAARLQALGCASVVFDRGGYLYHGRIKALADAAREAGLRF